MSEPLFSKNLDELLPASDPVPRPKPDPRELVEHAAPALLWDQIAVIARLQRQLAWLMTIVAGLCLVALAEQIFDYDPDRDLSGLATGIFAILVIQLLLLLIAWVFTLKLASRVLMPSRELLAILLSLVPGGLLIVLPWVNMTATALLRRNGAKVGLFGVGEAELSRLAGEGKTRLVPDLPAERLLAIARHQRNCLRLLLAWIGLVCAVAAFAALTHKNPIADRETVGWVMLAIYIPFKLVALTLTVRLAMNLLGRSGVWGAAAASVFSLMVGLLWVNARATEALRRNGVQVGFLGAKRAELDRLSSASSGGTLPRLGW